MLASLFFVVFVLLALRLFARSVIYPRPRVPMPEESELAGQAPNARLVRYATADGIPLKGIIVGAGSRAQARVLYFHGNAESATQNLPLAEELARGGIETFLAEYRGYSGLPGWPTEAGLRRDGEAALTAFLGAHVDAAPLILVGRSLGSGVA
ncbi:MAG TPA: alpha/beta hydrolase, partial [Thermoanaerobaculia bacterium]|nr:alpha/beta hydrolase [Thermoanaerobaculia bacterium]